jgi:hypothetical protein
MANTPVRQYIGARYVPLFADPAEWDNTKTYEPLTIVLHEGNSYTSRQYVPTGIDINNNEYWALTGNYNAQIETYRAETQANTSKFTAMGIDTTNEATEFLHRIETLDNDSTFNKEIIKAGFGADTIDAATTSYKSNYMDIRKLGCIENDETQDCGAIINTYLANHPTASIYVPNGVWYTKSTITISGEQNIICDGFIRLGTGYILNENTMIALDGGDATISSAMTKGKTFKINVDGNMQNVNGISIKGYHASTFELESIRAMGIAIRTISRNIENNFNIRFYGGYNDEYAQIGFQTASNDNDNHANVIGRNANIGIDNQASYWFYEYVHVWGCDEGVRLRPNTMNVINNYYPDYTKIALTCNALPSANIKINNIQSILPRGYYLIGDETNNHIILNANNVYIPAGYAQMFKTSPAGFISNIMINNFNNTVIQISADDLNNFTTLQEFIDKYGYISSDEQIPNITICWPSMTADYDYDAFINTQAGRNLTMLKYHVSRNTEYLWGKSTIYVTKRLLRIPSYPQRLLWEVVQDDMPAYYMFSLASVATTNMVLKALSLDAKKLNELPIG